MLYDATGVGIPLITTGIVPDPEQFETFTVAVVGGPCHWINTEADPCPLWMVPLFAGSIVH